MLCPPPNPYMYPFKKGKVWYHAGSSGPPRLVSFPLHTPAKKSDGGTFRKGPSTFVVNPANPTIISVTILWPSPSCSIVCQNLGSTAEIPRWKSIRSLPDRHLNGVRYMSGIFKLLFLQ